MEVVTEVGQGEEVAGGGASGEVRGVSGDMTGGQVTAVTVDVGMTSDEEENGGEAEKVRLDSEGEAWAGFDSSHRPFLQQGNSTKSNKQKETLSTTTTGHMLRK